MPELPEFDEALARAVQDGIGQGRTAGAADAMLRGRKRSLRARGGVAVLGVAAIGGSLGVGSAFGDGTAKTAAVATAVTSSTTGHSASAPTSSTEAPAVGARAAGLLAGKLWPGYDVEHWNPQPVSLPGVTKNAASMVPHCYPSNSHPPMPELFPITGMAVWGNDYDTSHHVNADYLVYTFADDAKAAAFVADARDAGAAPACGSGPWATTPAPGVSTPDGVSWLITQEKSPVGNLPSVEHTWLVRSGNRVALFRISQFGTDYKSTAGDKKLLAEMRQALEK